MPLRPYQSNAIDRTRALLQAGLKRVLIVGPTGCGKTTIFSAIVESALALGTRCLILAHRRELLKAPTVRFLRAGVDPAKLGVILAGVEAGPPKQILGSLDDADDDLIWHCMARRRPDAPVQVASIDTLRARTKPPADLIIVDEAHRMLSASYLKLAEEYPNAVFLGLTATPLRSDNKPLGDFYADMVTVATYQELVRDGFLIEPRVWTVPAGDLPDLSQVRIKGGDYDSEQLTAACDKSTLVGNIVEHWKRHGNDSPTFCFAVSRDHSRHIAQQFVDAGIPAEHVDANTPVEQRDAAVRKLKTGELRVLCNVDVMTEGVDVPACKTIILARPTKSLRVALQAIGRGSRPHKGGKPFVVLDHAGVVLEHGLPQRIEFAREILWAPKSKSSLKSAPVKTCPSCFACVPAAAPVCPECSHEFQAKPRGAPEEEEGDLIEVTPPSEADLLAAWTTITAECVARGYRPAWAGMRWQEQYPGTRPPGELPSEEQCAAQRGKNAEILDEYVAVALRDGYKIGWIKSSFKARTGQYPSNDLMAKTAIREVLAGWLAGLGKVFEIGRSVEQVEQVKVSVPMVSVERVAAERVAAANDLIEYSLEA